MLKYQVWECEICGKQAQSDGFPNDWFHLELYRRDRLGERETELIDADLCSDMCVRKLMTRYLTKGAR